jgi:hypothetical protein
VKSTELIRDLEDRIHDLENDLEVSLVAQKHLKLVASRSEQKMLAYQKFIDDLCLALLQKCVVRVIDRQGTEASYNLYKTVSSKLILLLNPFGFGKTLLTSRLVSHIYQELNVNHIYAE